jgi:signal transduction histidine kinase
MERTSRRALREMQALLLELRPVALEDVGLTAALGELCQAYRSRLGLEVSAQIGPVQAGTAVEHAVLRVVQEALANAVKHGDPASVLLSVHQVGGQVHVRVRDDGAGFDPATSARGGGLGLGLGTMRERVTGLGGQLAVESAPGAGTTITVTVPAGVPPDEDADEDPGSGLARDPVTDPAGNVER